MNQTPQVHLLRSGLVITLRCTLKCKLCGGYIPCYKNPQDIPFDEVARTIDSYFSVVDTVGDFSLTGGEPLLNPDLGRIIEKAMEYGDQIGALLILTNGTLLFQEDTLKILKKHRHKCQVTISDYGKVSPKASLLSEILKENEIPCRVINYSGENLFCDGWVDFGDHTQKHFTQEEIDEQGRRCAVRNRHCNFYILHGELHSCGRAYRRMELGIIPKNRSEYVDLLDGSIPNEEKRETVLNIYHSVSATSCAYCNGLCADSPRFPPAEQL